MQLKGLLSDRRACICWCNQLAHVAALQYSSFVTSVFELKASDRCHKLTGRQHSLRLDIHWHKPSNITEAERWRNMLSSSMDSFAEGLTSKPVNAFLVSLAVVFLTPILWTIVHQYVKVLRARGIPPGPAPLPILGNLGEILSSPKRFDEWCLQKVKEFDCFSTFPHSVWNSATFPF